MTLTKRLFVLFFGVTLISNAQANNPMKPWDLTDLELNIFKQGIPCPTEADIDRVVTKALQENFHLPLENSLFYNPQKYIQEIKG